MGETDDSAEKGQSTCRIMSSGNCMPSAHEQLSRLFLIKTDEMLVLVVGFVDVMISPEHKWRGTNRFCGTRDKGPIVYYAPREYGGCSENLANKNVLPPC